MAGASLEDRLFETDFALGFFVWDNAVYVALAFALILAARYLYAVPFWFMTGKGFCVPSSFRMNYMLIHDDNKAIAVSLASFIVALAMVVNGQVGSAGSNGARNVVFLFIWVSIAFFALLGARFFNVFAIIRSVDSFNKMSDEGFVAVAAMESGAVLGSAFIIRASVLGDASANFWEDLGSSSLFFLAGQMAFVAWSFILTRFIMKIDLQRELMNNNVAAGLSVGLNLVAFGYLLSIPIANTDSIIGFLVWMAFGAAVTFVLRLVVNKFMLYGEDMDREIVEDKNWGVSLVEGASLLMITMICDTFVGLDTGNNVVNCKTN